MLLRPPVVVVLVLGNAPLESLGELLGAIARGPAATDRWIQLQSELTELMT